MTSESINLKNLLKEYKYESTTGKIRDLQHSSKIRKDIAKMIDLKKKYSRLDNKKLRSIVEKQCSFLYANYTNIFNKIFKDNIDLTLFHKFLVVLKKIEEGKCDQHEASVQVGTILKEIYIDSAVREGNKNEKRTKEASKPRKGKNISWADYKKIM